ncbi:o-succinylbenzoate synthase [Vreelandella piezotolerans]|uniref:o-succinylbenzoate synthase n=1 Tax=Vreelandella piezotolerans TaxID=2609667 RepID=A0ABQ6XAA1_9GAMM|nr:o-succinylbenzoate synthase [Halomonas piezotolerans]KAE8438929.1 o-succinylbenzoate synthase [Halomonas piezotolerans]QJA26084.1 o-succinylbenzoate synthase [Halomonas piezotolerans]
MARALYRYALALTRPLTLNGERLTQREGLLVNIDGQWGEIAPLPGFSCETLAQAEAEALAYLAAFERGEVPTPQLASVQFGLGCARRAWPERLPQSPAPYPLLQGTPAHLMIEIEVRLKAWRTAPPERLKLKVARYPINEELALIKRISERLPTTRLILDANGGFTREQARRFCAGLPPGQIDYLEEPCAALTDTQAVAEATGVPFALDETLSRQRPWQAHPQLAALVIKPTLIGSLAACQALVERARALGLRVVVSSSFESELGLELLSRLAREWAPGEPPGLDTGGWLAGRLTDQRGAVMVERCRCLYHSA